MPDTQPNSSTNRTAQILETPLKLRAELRIALRHADGDTYCQLENQFTGQFFRLGLAEWEFASSLRPDLTPAQILASEHCPLDPHQAATVCMFLVHSGLAEAAGDAATRATARQVGLIGLLTSLLYKRVPLVAPDRWLTKITPKLGWLFSKTAVGGWVALVLFATCAACAQYDRFLTESSAYFFPNSWWLLLVVWLGLKLVHELGHGVVCKRYGGHVGSAGIVFILLSPIAFVDVTSSWRFRSRWQRIATATGGMYVEFAIASIAAIIWAYGGKSYAAHLAHHVMFTAGVSTLLFNANPLMRFDGYYILSDLIDVQNLYTNSALAVRSKLLWLLGLQRPGNATTPRRPYLTLIYGVLAMFWRITMSASLIVVACQMFQGAGVLIAILAVIVWFAIPMCKTMRALYAARAELVWSRLLGLCTVAVILLAIVVGMPVPFGVSVPAVVEYDPVELVRAEANGFVTQVHVNSGESVRAGQLLLEIRDDEAIAQLQSVRSEIAQAEIESRVRLQFGDVSTYQSDLQEIEALKQRQQMLEQVAEGLMVRAGSDGVVLDAYPDELCGQYFHAGAPLISIGNESNKRMQLSIPEHHAERLFGRVGVNAKVQLDGRMQSDAGNLESIDPSASDLNTSPHLLAVNGGPLAVAFGDEESPDARLVSPRFRGTVSVSNGLASQLKAGQRGIVRLHDSTETLSAKLRRVTSTWVHRRVDPR